MPISSVQVLGAGSHLAFVGADGKVYGMGNRIQCDYYGEEKNELFREIPLDVPANEIKRHHVGRFQRVVWTKDNRFFHNGEHRK